MPSKIIKWLLFLTALVSHLVGWTGASEFPERECCDPVYPPPIPTVPSSSVATPTGRSGPNIKTAIAILNCLLARQLCFEDASCSAILEIIPRVCGPELVACSTVTVTKCQAALRTLQAFPFFKPTCLCREPHMDPECNSFRDFLFDHPCVLVLKKEKDPYPVDALPTCNHALSVCQTERKCIKLFDDFKSNCKVRDNKCRMDDRELCHESWTNLRLSPMFGCICPNNHMKRRCDRIFSMVNHNPCVDILPFSFDLSGTDSALYPYDPEQGYFKNFWFPTTNLYPYFLFPPTSRPHHRLPAPHGTAHTGTVGTITLRTHAATGIGTTIDANDAIDAHQRGAISITGRPTFTNGSFHKYQGFTAIAGTITAHAVPTSSYDLFPFKVISTSDNGSSFDYGLDMGTESQVQNPLVDTESEDIHATILRDHISVTMLKNRVSHRQVFNISQYDEDIDVVRPHQHTHRKIYPSNYDVRTENNELSKVVFQSTCHLALDNCNNNYTCRMVLQPVLHYCDLSKCNRNACMEALQTFYRKPDPSWSLEVAFCLCKKTENKRDTCMIAQEKLHPVCAQRIEGAPTPTCHSLAKNCREDPECRTRLETYEQACAVDAVTKKCAGPPSECRTAMLGILGTELRTTCACKGTDFTQLYDCLGWQRLLWVNPCVVESQKDFHMKRQQYFTTPTPTIPTTTTTTTRMTTTEMKTTTSTFTIGQMTYMAYTEASYQTKETNTEFVYIPPPTNMTTITTTMATTTTAPKFCVFQRPQQSNQYIQEGKTKRMYQKDEVECSEICHCSIGGSLTCNMICVDRKPCKTEFALYNHAAPAYQAFRGRCLCYSGRFICMKPMPGEYSLPQGIFLFLGYSETDENLLKPHSNLTVHDAVQSLQEFLTQEADNGTLCTLSLFNVTRENIILIAKVAGHKEGPNVSPAAILEKEREECGGLLETISEKINSQHSDFNSHLLLSIFKMAEVEIVEMETSSGYRTKLSGSPVTIFLLLIILQIFYRPVCCSSSS